MVKDQYLSSYEWEAHAQDVEVRESYHRRVDYLLFEEDGARASQIKEVDVKHTIEME